MDIKESILSTHSCAVSNEKVSITLHYTPECKILAVKVNASKTPKRFTTVSLEGNDITVDYIGPKGTKDIDPLYKKLSIYADSIDTYGGMDLLKSISKLLELDKISNAVLLSSYKELTSPEDGKDFKSKMILRLDELFPNKRVERH